MNHEHSKRRKIAELPFGGIDIPPDFLGLLFWLVAKYLYPANTAALKQSCRAALSGFRANATSIEIRTPRRLLRILSRFYDVYPFHRVKHIRFRIDPGFKARSIVRWSRAMFPVASTMCIDIRPLTYDGGLPPRHLDALQTYPLDITEYKGDSTGLEQIAELTPIERWKILQRVSVAVMGPDYRSRFGPHAREIIRDHALEHATLYDPLSHLDDVMVHPPKSITIQSMAAGVLAAHPRSNEIAVVKFRPLHDIDWQMGYPSVTVHDVQKLLPKLDFISLIRTGDLHHYLLPTSPLDARVAAFVLQIEKYNGISATTTQYAYADEVLPAALDNPAFLARVLREAYDDYWEVPSVIDTLAVLAARAPGAMDKLVAVARDTFASIRHTAVPEYIAPRSSNVDRAFLLWKAYFTTCHFFISDPTFAARAECIVDRADAAIEDYHLSVTLAEQFLRGEASRGVTPSLQYLYPSVHPEQQVPLEACKNELVRRREYIATLCETLDCRRRDPNATSIDHKMIHIYEARLMNTAAECTGPLGKVLLGTGDFELL